jgi:3-oxoacyl-[acyl-carrier protein] reductase
MSASLSGQVAVVTGAGRGIGRAIAEELCREGAAVGLLARSAGELESVVRQLTDEGGSAVAQQADVTDVDAVAGAVEAVRANLGEPTLLVNNAGTAGAIGPVTEVEPDAWWHDVRSSVFGSFVVTRAVLPGMLARGTGRIVNIASYSGIRPAPHLSAYGAAKAALINFSESVAAETAAAGIKVFAVSPGHVRTALVQNMLESEEGQRWLPQTRDSTPLDARDSAKLVCRIAGGRYDALSGTFLHVLDDVEQLLRDAAEIVAGERYVPRLRR